MGPRQGSPAAETQKEEDKAFVSRSRSRDRKWRFLFLPSSLILGITCWWSPPALGASAEVKHTVTVVVVRPVLSISSDNEAPSLVFSDTRSGSQKETQPIQYQVAGNALPTGAYEGVLSAKIATSPSGRIVLQADIGSFANNGTSGNIVLHEQFPGYQTIGKTSTPLATKEASFGPQSTILNGTVPVTWKATTSEKLHSGLHTVTVILTLKDS